MVRVEASGQRVENDQVHVAAELAAAQVRADEALGDPGAAADAAALPPT